MRSTAWHKPLHPPFTDFPAALWVTSFVFDLLSYKFGRGVSSAATYCIAGGCLVALLAAVAGVMDFTRIGPRRDTAKRTALIHAGLNVLALMVFAVNLWARTRESGYEATPIGFTVLGGVGVALVAVSAYLGGQLVYDMGVNVRPVGRDSGEFVSGTQYDRELPTTRPFIPGRDVTLREPGAPRADNVTRPEDFTRH